LIKERKRNSAWMQSGSDDVISHAEGISDVLSVLGIEIDEFVFGFSHKCPV
jgi:hypothetical protein